MWDPLFYELQNKKLDLNTLTRYVLNVSKKKFSFLEGENKNTVRSISHQ